MGFFTSAEAKLAVAVSGIEKFIKKFDAAAEAAEKEMAGIDKELTEKVAKIGSKADKAREKYLAVNAAANARIGELIDSATSRREFLTTIKESAKYAAENYRKLYTPEAK